MALNKNAILEYEAGQTPQGIEEMTDSGDKKTFSSSAKPWSAKSGSEYSVKPNGMETGGNVIPAVSGNDDEVDVSAATANLAGAQVSVPAATNLAVTRGASTNTHIKNSIIVNSGGAFAVVAGTAHTAHSDTRGALGGPPYIPVDAIEVAQVHLTSISAAPVTASEIKQVVGLHRESAYFPLPQENTEAGTVTFNEALKAIHTGDLPKKVYVEYSTPSFAQLALVRDFVPAETSHSASSESYYDNQTVTSISTSVNQATFTVALRDGITDPFLDLINENIWTRFKQDKNKSPYMLTQGLLAVQTDFDPDGNPIANVTQTPQQASVRKSA